MVGPVHVAWEGESVFPSFQVQRASEGQGRKGPVNPQLSLWGREPLSGFWQPD